MRSYKIESLKDLFVEQGRELYDASKQEQKELPKIQKQASNLELKKIITRQLAISVDQTGLLQGAFKRLNASLEGERNVCSESILRQTKALIDRCTDLDVQDAVIINGIQRLNHNKITGFGSLAAYAREIGEEGIASSLHATLEEEKIIDKELSDLAESEINKNALVTAP